MKHTATSSLDSFALQALTTNIFQPYHLAIEVDRLLELSLSNYEFEILVSIIHDSEDPVQTAKNLMWCGVRATFYCIFISKP